MGKLEPPRISDLAKAAQLTRLSDPMHQLSGRSCPNLLGSDSVRRAAGKRLVSQCPCKSLLFKYIEGASGRASVPAAGGLPAGHPGASPPCSWAMVFIL